MVWGFSLDAKSENEGLDRTEHGEVGFDLGLAVEMAPAAAPTREPRPAMIPPNGKRHFTVVVEGANTGRTDARLVELVPEWADSRRRRNSSRSIPS